MTNKYIVESTKIISLEDRRDLLGATIHQWQGSAGHADIFDTGNTSNVSNTVCANGHNVPKATASTRGGSWEVLSAEIVTFHDMFLLDSLILS